RNDFLQGALQSINADSSLQDALLILKSESTNIQQKLDSLNVIRDKIDDIDHANSLVKVGGISIILQLIKIPDYNLRPNAICIVAEMSQNNEFCQKYFYNEHLIPVLTSTMNDGDDFLGRSSIFAVSSLIQNFSPGLNEFLRINGIRSLVSCLNSKHDSVYIRAAFLIASLASNISAVRELIYKENAVSILLGNLENKNEYDNKLESTLSALSALSTNFNWSTTQKQNAQAQTILKQLVGNKQLLEECEEMVNFARNILNNMTKK
ncbi:GH16834, partial [Drosophila grimshawi]